MGPSERREFLKSTGGALAGLLGWIHAPRRARADEKPPIRPPHRALRLDGVHAYPLPDSVAAGESLELRVSASVPYRLAIVRLGPEVDAPDRAEVMEEITAREPDVQPIHPGSYIAIEKALPLRPLRELSIECWVRPWDVSREQAIIAQLDRTRLDGLGLLMAREGRVTLHLGRGVAGARAVESPDDIRLARLRWHHVAGAFDGKEAALFIDGREVARKDLTGDLEPPVAPANVPLAIGATTVDGVADLFLDADIAFPAIYSRALSSAEIRRRFEDRGLSPPAPVDLLGAWPLSEERGTRVADLSGQDRHGVIVNHGTWMIGGPSFDPNVPRFGDYDPLRDPKRGHALRLASDDLYDCGWEPTHEIRVPVDAKPGLWCARFEFEVGGEKRYQHVTFIVRRPRAAKPPPILVLVATNTWRAYGGTPFAKIPPQVEQVWGTGGIENEKGDPPAYCFYRPHRAGQGTYQLGTRMPWPVASPYVLYGGRTRYSHLSRAEIFTHAWLERAGYEFDVATDLDLDQDPELLSRHRAVVINGHSEYWSAPMLDGLRRFLDGGGNVICLSGNSLFWRVSHDPETGLIECRKVDCPGDQMPPERRGECWHSLDGKRGGLLRECGHPAWPLIGLDCIGWIDAGDPEQFGPYIVEEPDHFLFKEPRRVDVGKGNPIGVAAQGPSNSGGHEVDVRPSTIRRLSMGAPLEGGKEPDDPAGMTLLARGQNWGPKATVFDWFIRMLPPNDARRPVGAELVWWERPEGGKVLNAGAIGAGWCLLSDERFATMVQNALSAFGIEPS